MTQDSKNRRRSGVIISYVYVVAQLIVQLLYVPLLLNGIGQDEYGLYQLIGSIMSYVISINSVLSAGVTRFYCKYLAQNDSRNMENTLAIAKRMYWVLSAVSFAVVLGLIFAVQAIYSNSLTNSQLLECSAMLVVLGLNTVITMNNTINIAAISSHERFVFLKSVQLITLVVQPLLIILLINYYPNALVVTLVILLLNIVSSIARSVFAKSILQVKSTYHGFDKDLFKGLFCFSSAILLVVLADQIFWKTDQLIIGYYYGASAVAIYAIGAQIYQAYMPVGSTVASVFLPRVSELYCKDGGLLEISNLFIKVGRISFMVCSLVLSAFIIIGNDFICLWAGSEFQIAYYIAIIVMIPFTIDLIQNIGLTILQVFNKYYFKGLVNFTIAILNLVATVFLVQSFGLLGAAYSTAVAMFLGNGLIMNWYYQYKIKLDVVGFWKNIFKIAASVIFYIACSFGVYRYFFSGCSWVIMIIFTIAYSLIFIVILRFVCMNNSEKLIFDGLVKKSFYVVFAKFRGKLIKK